MTSSFIKISAMTTLTGESLKKFFSGEEFIEMLFIRSIWKMYHLSYHRIMVKNFQDYILRDTPRYRRKNFSRMAFYISFSDYLQYILQSYRINLLRFLHFTIHTSYVLILSVMEKFPGFDICTKPRALQRKVF